MSRRIAPPSRYPTQARSGRLRVDVRVVRAKAGVELGVPCRRWLGVAVPRPGQPPAAHLAGSRGIPHVDDAVALVVLRVARREVGGAPAQVNVLAVDEPQVVDAARGRPRGVEPRHRPRAGGIGHVEDLEARRLHARTARLVGHDEEVADQVERVRAHLAVRQVALEDHARPPRLGHVDAGDVLRPGLVGQPQHTATVPRELDDHALAAVAEAVQGMVGEELHVAPGSGRHGPRF